MTPRRLLRLMLALIGVLALGYGALRGRSPAAAIAPSVPPASPQSNPSSPPSTDPAILSAIRNQRSHVWGQAAGVVTRLLKDDREGSPHQRFLIRIEGGTTILVAYNLELAPRIVPLTVGDTVFLRGEYLWNDKGGLMHWVHRDPSGREPGGWVRVREREYR